MTPLVPPIAAIETIGRADVNACLVAWGHKMGPWNRPENIPAWFHGLTSHGELVAVAAAGLLMAERVAGLRRTEAVELGRLCAASPTLCRPMLRLWREFVLPDLARAHGYGWAVSYQDAAMHTGNLYRFDGWVRLATSSSGPDRRSGRKGRNKVIWGWQIPMEKP